MEDLDKKIDDRIKKFMGGKAFTVEKVTDTPTDALHVVNRKYITLNGTSANRPTSSVVGQRYFDTTLGLPVYWNGTAFVDAAGNVV